MTHNKSNNAIRAQIDGIRKDGNIMGFERWRKIGETVVADLKARGEFFNTDQGLFFFDREDHQMLCLNQDELALASLLNRRYGINMKEHGFGRVLGDLESEAYAEGKKNQIRRLAHFDQETKYLYVSRFDGQAYRLDGNAVSKIENGADNVFFFDDRALSEPYDYSPNVVRGEFDRKLIDSVNFIDSVLTKGEQQKLLKLWLLSVFFGSIQPTKVILLLLGDHGSGKTSALRRIQKFIFGPRTDLLSIEKDKQDGFVATVTTDPIALFDNLDERISWLPYALSRLATGVTFTRRVLYTTNTKAEYPAVSWLGITARSARFMEQQPDLPDRTLVLNLARLTSMQPEGELVSAIAQCRNVMWSEFLDQLNVVVRHFREKAEPITVQFRMADFASFAMNVATAWDCREEVEGIFTKLEEAQGDLVFEDEPISQILDLWLADAFNRGRAVDAASLYREWSAVASQNQISWRFANSQSLAQRLGSLRHALGRQFKVEVTNDTNKKQYRYKFWPIEVTYPVAAD